MLLGMLWFYTFDSFRSSSLLAPDLMKLAPTPFSHIAGEKVDMCDANLDEIRKFMGFQ